VTRHKVAMAMIIVAVLLNNPLQIQSAHAQDADAAKAVKPQVVVTNLENPSGVAINAKTGHVFIASRYGIYRYDPKNHRINLEIEGYPEDVYGKGPKYTIGPLGVAFMDDDHLVVADGSRPDPEELVRVYKVPAEAPKAAVAESKAAYTLGPIPPGAKTEKGEGNFYGVAVGAGAIFVSANGDDTKGWVAKSDIKDGKPGKLKLAIATKEATKVDAPVPVTFSPDGKELVVGQMGEISEAGDSLLTFYNPADGKLSKMMKAGINDIAGIAYSPITKKIYATDFAWLDSGEKDEAKKQGGLYRLDIEGDTIKPEKILALDKPAGLAFDKEGNLYITVFGSPKEGDPADLSPGTLIVIKKDAGL